MHLGTGDYGHLVVDHSAMLLRHFRSLCEYSGQGFESSHKLHRQLYSKATNHDASGPGQSCESPSNFEFIFKLCYLKSTSGQNKLRLHVHVVFLWLTIL